MAVTLNKSMNRAQLCENYGWSGKTFNRRLRPYFEDRFDRIRLFTPGQIAEIIGVLGSWEAEIKD